jgi:hypothetical protein
LRLEKKWLLMILNTEDRDGVIVDCNFEDDYAKAMQIKKEFSEIVNKLFWLDIGSYKIELNTFLL